MITKVNVSTIYECSLERAFKTPMLSDVSKIHTGFGIMPKVTHTTDDRVCVMKNGKSKRLLECKQNV